MALVLVLHTVHIKLSPNEIEYLCHMEGRTLGFAGSKQHRKSVLS